MSQDIRPLIDEDTQLPDMDLSDTNPRLPPTPPYSIHDKPGAYWQSASPSPSRRNSTVHTKLPFPLPPSYTPATKILEIDKKTPDNHVPRDPRLIRLTGTHPFNVEAPLSSLYDEGFLTSPSNFYVRNHGPVPQVSDAESPDWSFTIEGLVEHPITITLRALIEEYEQVTVPITLVCAGNRRKEQNVVRKSKGFSWGAAGVSNALWTGVPLCEVLKRAAPKRRARYVCMEGAETLPNGNYGTSVKLNWALDPNRGIMLAHMMNGETLTPDHGKPLRVVVPGMIGGRSVKWLKRIIVSEGPSENWYHINDNRVLPTMVSPEMSATEEGKKWWMDERYAIYDLSTNSATVYPAHDEVLRLDQGKETYTVRGYAYGGGGRRVTRVEISLDQGRSWMLADINYDEDKYRDLADENQQLCNGRLDVSWRETCFCWCFWHLEVPVAQLGDAKDILVRAMDESLSVQPRDMYWSVLGMMNNPWFRVAIIREGDALRFEHPTQPALIPGGWMERVKKAGGDLSNGFWGEQIGGQALQQVDKEVVPEVKMTNEDVKREITIEELRAHESETEPWFVVNGEVYDGTGFLEGHPGGVSSIVNSGAQDVTDEFMAIHSETAKAMMPKYHIGTLSPSSLALLNAPPSASSPESSTPKPIFLHPKMWIKALLSKKTVISSDTRIFKFSLEHPQQTLGLPTGQHVFLRLRDPVTNESIIRPYTPYSSCTQLGNLDVLVKVYFDTAARPGGKMTKALEALAVAETVEFKGPLGKFEYLGRGRCAIGPQTRLVRRFVMICGGSGVTPIFQVLRAVMQDRGDGTRCVVLDGNRTEEDILCREEIDGLTEGREEQCRVVHTLSKPGEKWEGGKGRIGRRLLEEEVGRFGQTGYAEGEELVLICGPEPLEKEVKEILNGLGWGNEYLLFF